MPNQVTLRRLLEVGAHFGHRTQKWNPKMSPYIFTARNGIHILDLQQTVVEIDKAYNLIRDIVQRGGFVLFVGTKRQAAEIVAQEADRCAMPYVNTRWLGGTITNWSTIKQRIDTLKKLEKDREEGRFTRLTKKEGLVLERKIEKLQMRLGGLREMKKRPDLLLVVDTEREATAVKEANTQNIPVLALADTNSNPDHIDFIVPSNDDAMRAIKLVIATFADAVIEGRAMRKGSDDTADGDLTMGNADLGGFSGTDEGDDSALLGPNTLGKLRDNTELFAEDDDSVAPQAAPAPSGGKRPARR